MREVLTRSSWLAASTYFLSSNALLNASIASWNWKHRKYDFINQLMHCSLSASNMTTCVIPLSDGRAPLWRHCFSPAAASALHIQSQPREYSAAPASKCANAKCDQLLRRHDFNQALFHTLTSFSIQFLRPSISLEISSTWTISSSELWRLGRKSLYLLFIVSQSSSYDKHPEREIPNWFRGKMFKS